MEKEQFARRMSQLRQAKGVSARDMSLSLGQSAGYINNIENGVNLPSMAMFFYICDYLEVTPEEFFSMELADPMRLKRLNQSLRRLTGHQLELLELLVQELIRITNEMGVSRLFLEVRESNERAIHVYEKAGFVKNGLRKNYYEDPVEHAVLMMHETVGKER